MQTGVITPPSKGQITCLRCVFRLESDEHRQPAAKPGVSSTRLSYPVIIDLKNESFFHFQHALLFTQMTESLTSECRGGFFEAFDTNYRAVLSRCSSFISMTSWSHHVFGHDVMFFGDMCWFDGWRCQDIFGLIKRLSCICDSPTVGKEERGARLKPTTEQLRPDAFVLFFSLQVSKSHVSSEGLSMRETVFMDSKQVISNAESISILAKTRQLNHRVKCS